MIAQPAGAPAYLRRIGVGVAAAAGALLALSGCAAGQHAQTANETPVVDGVAADAGPVALRAVTVSAPDAGGSYAQGGDATLQLVIVNDSIRADELVKVTTGEASDVRMFANAADAGGASSPVTTPSEAPSGSPSGSETPGSETPGSETPSESALPTIDAIDLPPGRATSIGYSPDMPVIQLHGLTRRLFPAESFPITFQFAEAGLVTFTIAVHLAPARSSTPTIDITPTAEI